MYAQLGNSYQWKMMNANDAVMNKINDVLENGKIIYPVDIPSTMLKLKNRVKSPITSQVTSALEDGRIVMLYAPTVKIPIYLPFIISQPKPNTITGYVFINSFVSSTAGDELTIEERKLKVALEACYLGIQIRNLGDSPKLRSSAIIKSGSKIYSGVLTECINRKHGIKLDQTVHNSILYLTSKYYIYTMLGCRNMTDEALDNYCFYNCNAYDPYEIRKIGGTMSDDTFDNISTFISGLTSIPELNKRLGKMTVSNFIESYINMYDTPMLFGLENFTYFLYNILSVNESTYINNYQALKNIVGDDGRKIYADLVVSIC